MRRLSVGLATLFLLASCGGHKAPAPAPVPVPAGPPVEHPTPAEIREAGELITEVNTRARLSVIADDSMGGRNTPSPGLEKVAQYLADNYARWGLLPAGENGSYFVRYPIVKTKLNLAQSYLELREAGRVTRYSFDNWAYLAPNITFPKPVTGATKIIGGAVTPADLDNVDLRGRIVIFVQDSNKVLTNGPVLVAIRAKLPAALVVLRNNNPAQMMTTVATAVSGTPQGLAGVPPNPNIIPTVTVQDTLWADAGAPNRPNWNDVRHSSKPVILDAPPEFVVSIMSVRDTVDRVTAPVVVAKVIGSDPVLRDEYVVYSGHMDHIGTAGQPDAACRPFTRLDGSVDTICNGADDDGSGTTGVMSVAQAVAAMKSKPKRSILIVNVSGEEKGLWGSAYFAEHPTVPIKQIVADINMDMIGRNSNDSIVVIGKEHSDMGTTLAKVQAAHPELALTASDDIWPEQSFYTRSDHFNFAKKGVPVLFFFNGTHPQYHRPDDEIGLINFSKLSRVARLAFYFGIEIANTVERPKWNPESYQTIVVEGKVPVPVVKKP